MRIFVAGATGAIGRYLVPDLVAAGPGPLPATRQSMAAIRHIEQTVPNAVPEGLVLRYGMFHGPVSEWLPYLSECPGAKPPVRAPAWLGRLLAGPLVVSLMTQARGSANAKARREPGYPSWRDGFPQWVKQGVRQ